jgi:hypothetical protein
MAGLLILAVLLAVGILTSSGNKTKQHSYEERAKQANPPEHEWVQDDPTPGAWVLAFIAIAVCCYIFVTLGGMR